MYFKKCRNCGCELADDARFCSACGTASGRTECRNCGCELANDARFCSTCGTAPGRTDSQPVMGTHVDDSGIEEKKKSPSPDMDWDGSLGKGRFRKLGSVVGAIVLLVFFVLRCSEFFGNV